MPATEDFNGSTVYVGVKWNIDTSTISIWAYPSSGGGSYTVSGPHNWINECTNPECSACGQQGVLDCHGGLQSKPDKKGATGKWGAEGQIYCTKCDVDWCGVTGKELSGTGKYPGLKPASGEAGSGLGESGGGEKSGLLSGEMSFGEIISTICNGTDTLFLCKRSIIHITDFPSLYTQALHLREHHPKEVAPEDIQLWQLEDGSYELNIDQYGFYNTVHVKYNKGTITESSEDLVRVYGKKPITYNHKNIDKSSAQMMAKAYLAAHERDFGMSINATVIHDGGIDIGDMVTLENPLTMRDYLRKEEGRSPELYFVSGISVSWDDSPIMNDIELKYGPENPDNPGIPETGDAGGSTFSGSAEQAVTEVAKLTKKINYKSGCTEWACVKSSNSGDCWGMSDFIYTELTNRGVEAKIVEYAAWSSNHRSVLYKNNGKWVRFPYRGNVKNEAFNDTAKAITATKIIKP